VIEREAMEREGGYVEPEMGHLARALAVYSMLKSRQQRSGKKL
jgi:hypothetical protein